MKLPRWLVISMLSSSLLAVLAAAGWWWVTWPERTARKLTDLMAIGDLPTANPLMTNAKWHDNGPGFDFILDQKEVRLSYPVKKGSKLTLKMETPNLMDRLAGKRRLTYLVVNELPIVFQEHRLDFVVERGSVRCELISWGKGKK